MRWRGYSDSWYHGTYRACRNPPGDSISAYPAKTISEKAKETIAEYTRRLARALHVIGMINIQFIVLGDDVYVIEVNPRSSRTVPYISKVTGIPIVPLATKVILDTS